MQVVEAEFEFSRLKESILELFRTAANQKKLTLEFIIDQDVPERLVGDEARLRQILFNLVGNALKFTENGHVRVEASVAQGRDAASCGEGGPCRLLFSVEDTGIGIPDERLRDIFEPFVQAKDTYCRNYQGAGLGLSIVRRLVRLLGGDIAVDNTEGGGTTFYFSMPYKLPQGKPEALESERQTLAFSGETPPSILLADDDALTALSMKRLLGKEGYTVTVATNGQEAVRLLKEQDFALILMDIQMPVMDGVEATIAIRSSTTLGAKARIPIVATTAYSMTGDREKFLAAGMDDYISKPIDMVALREVVARNIAESASAIHETVV
jgi:CheY-like chemotaxis protein/two-component sensor histidine kinase